MWRQLKGLERWSTVQSSSCFSRRPRLDSHTHSVAQSLAAPVLVNQIPSGPEGNACTIHMGKILIHGN